MTETANRDDNATTPETGMEDELLDDIALEGAEDGAADEELHLVDDPMGDGVEEDDLEDDDIGDDA